MTGFETVYLNQYILESAVLVHVSSSGGVLEEGLSLMPSRCRVSFCLHLSLLQIQISLLALWYIYMQAMKNGSLSL